MHIYKTINDNKHLLNGTGTLAAELESENPALHAIIGTVRTASGKSTGSTEKPLHLLQQKDHTTLWLTPSLDRPASATVAQ